MNWDEKAIDQAEQMDRKDSDWYALAADLLFRDGAKWQRDQLRTDEAVEIAAQAIYAEERRVIDPAWPVWEDPRNGEARESTREAVRHMLNTLLGEDQ